MCEVLVIFTADDLLGRVEMQERLRAIEKDKRLYSMEESEVKVQETLLKPERTKRDSLRLSRQLSRRYPGLPLDLALREENAKLRKELDHMRVSNLPDVRLKQCFIRLCASGTCNWIHWDKIPNKKWKKFFIQLHPSRHM